jgi:hypothetical protein
MAHHQGSLNVPMVENPPVNQVNTPDSDTEGE